MPLQTQENAQGAARLRWVQAAGTSTEIPSGSVSACTQIGIGETRKPIPTTCTAIPPSVKTQTNFFTGQQVKSWLGTQVLLLHLSETLKVASLSTEAMITPALALNLTPNSRPISVGMFNP